MSDAQAGSVPPTTPLTVTMTMRAAYWEALIKELHEVRMPYQLTAPLIGQIFQQSQAQIAAMTRPEPMRPYELQRGLDSDNGGRAE